MSEVRRDDIQCLRAIAVLAVLFYHADVPGFRGGFLGVDVFFVISGLLITTVIVRDVEARRFSFLGFYWRRLKRLQPAALVVFAVAGYGLWCLLTPAQLPAMRAQLLGGAFSVANIVMWQTTGYFAVEAHASPFLHAWSLSLEEQYYLLLPLVLAFCPARFRRWLIGLGLLASAALCLRVAPSSPGAAFYLLPFRGWELLLGSLGALVRFPRVGPRATTLLALASLIVIAVPFVQPLDPVHPRGDAAAVCIATLGLLAYPPAFLVRGPVVRVLRFFGDISYSLYLVHWPLFVAARVLYGGDLPAGAAALCIVLSVLLAFLLYRFVEDPIRARLIKPSLRVALAFGGAAGAVFVPLVLLSGTRVDAWTHLRRTNYGLGSVCDQSGGFHVLPACQTTERPTLLVWGDSFAMHLVPGIAAQAGAGGVLQATESSCAPLGDTAHVGGPGQYGADWARGCVAFNREVLAYLAAHPELETVVLAAKLRHYFDDGAYLWTPSGVAPPTEAALARQLIATVGEIRRLGRRVVLIGPPPSPTTDVGECLERRARGLPFLALDAGCSYPESAYRAKWESVLRILAEVATRADVHVIYPAATLCHEGTCIAADGDTYLMRDSGHFSIEGSLWYARRANLLAEIQATAH